MSNSVRSIAGTPPGVQVEGPDAARNTAAPSTPITSKDSAAVASDGTVLSPLADVLQAAANRASSLSSFRPALVAQLKSAVADGTYQPDPNLVAARVAAAVKRR